MQESGPRIVPRTRSGLNSDHPSNPVIWLASQRRSLVSPYLPPICFPNSEKRWNQWVFGVSPITAALVWALESTHDKRPSEDQEGTRLLLPKSHAKGPQRTHKRRSGDSGREGLCEGSRGRWKGLQGVRQHVHLDAGNRAQHRPGL